MAIDLSSSETDACRQELAFSSQTISRPGLPCSTSLWAQEAELLMSSEKPGTTTPQRNRGPSRCFRRQNERATSPLLERMSDAKYRDVRHGIVHGRDGRKDIAKEVMVSD